MSQRGVSEQTPAKRSGRGLTPRPPAAVCPEGIPAGDASSSLTDQVNPVAAWCRPDPMPHAALRSADTVPFWLPDAVARRPPDDATADAG